MPKTAEQSLSLFCGFDSYRFVCSIIPYLYTRCCARMIANLYHVLTAVDDIMPWLRAAYRCCAGVPDTWLAVVLYLIYNHVDSPIASFSVIIIHEFSKNCKDNFIICKNYTNFILN